MIGYMAERFGVETPPHDTYKHQRLRDEIARHTREFQLGGGEIQQIPPGVSGMDMRMERDGNGRIKWVTNRYSQLFLDKRDGKGRQPARWVKLTEVGK